MTERIVTVRVITTAMIAPPDIAITDALFNPVAELL